MTTTAWKASGTFLDFEGFNIFYKDSGKSALPALVLLHGFPTASWDYWKMWVLLEDKFRLISFDFLGFGFSDKPQHHSYSIHQQADITAHLMRHLGIHSYHIITHDYGVSVAQELLARQDESKEKNIRSICFLNGGIFAEMHRPLLIQKMMLSPIGKFMPIFLGRHSLEKNFKKIFGPDTQATATEIDEFWTLLSNNDGKWVFPLLIKYMLDRKKYRDRWCLPLIEPSIPIRLINGNKDPISGKHVTERYLELYSKADVINLPNIGHYPNTEAAAEVVKHFLAFVAK